MQKQLLNSRQKAITVGILILVAYGVIISSITPSKIIVVLADGISGLAVIGIAALLFPLLKTAKYKLSLGYLSLKIAEGSIMIFGGIIFLFDSLQPLRDKLYDGIHLYAFILSGFFLYHLLYVTRIIPRYISVWGTIAISALLLRVGLHLAGLAHSMVDILLILIVTNEIYLAIWLMVKGFNQSEIDFDKT